MALKVKAQEKLQKIGTHAGKYRYIMMPELYTSLSQDKNGHLIIKYHVD
jgi:hypothetical protein